MNVGIVSLFYHNWNFGGQLQAYALCQAVRHMRQGAQVEQIPVNNIASYTKRSPLRFRIRSMLLKSELTRSLLDRYYLWRNHDQRDLLRFRQFEQKEIPHYKYVGSPQALNKCFQRYGGIISGSDQVWNAGFFSEEVLRMYGLTAAPATKRKISYAASMGAEQAAVGKEELFREILDGLDFISVREKSAQAFLQSLTDRPVTVVLDPTMLLTRKEWDKLAVGPGREPAHLFAYFLAEPDNRHDGQLHAIAETLGLPVRCIADEAGAYPRPNSVDSQRWDAGPKEFLGEIRDAELVLTNSFHGIVFSVLFQKPFWVFKRNKDSDSRSMNARVTDFLTDFGLENRLLEDGEIPTKEKLVRPIDYETAGRLLETKRDFSLNWLRKALEGI